MIQLIAGLGKLAVQPKIENGDTKLYLGTLSKEYEIGTTFKDDDLQRQDVLITFKNEEGLDVLIKALNILKKHFIKIPDELRMGA